MTAKILALPPEYAHTRPTPWADELHPHWCPDRYGSGCGSHVSEYQGVRATADPADIHDGWAPLAQVAAYMGKDGTLGVQVHVDHQGAGESWATFTPDEWRALVALGERALALLASDPQMATRPQRSTA